MEDYTIHKALFEQMLRKQLIELYVTVGGATLDEAYRWVGKSELTIKDGNLVVVDEYGMIDRYSIHTSINLHALPETPEEKKHNDAIRNRDIDFSKI